MIGPTPSQARDGSFERASTSFIQRYLQEWSGPTPAALAYMDKVFPDQVEFYGKPLNHAAVMSLKHRFAMRWPNRTLSVRPGSIGVACDPNNLCAVRAIFDWHYESPARQAVSRGSAILELELLEGMTISSENGKILPSVPIVAPAPVHPQPIPPIATQPASPPDIPTAPAAEPTPKGEQVAPREESKRQTEESRPRPDEIAALRNTYFAHATDKDWITAWLAQKRDFSGQAIFVGSTDDQAALGQDGALRTDGFISAAGTVACISRGHEASLRVGEKVEIHGVITVFVEDVMFLGQCSIKPG
jgi:hypothetical protein